MMKCIPNAIVMFDVTTLLAIFIGGQFTLQLFCLVYGYLMYRRAMKLLAPRTQPDFGDIMACQPVRACGDGQCGNGDCPCGPDCSCGHHDDESDDDSDNLAEYPEFTAKMNAAYTRYHFKRNGRVEFALLQTAVNTLIDALGAEVVDHDYVDTVLDEIAEVYEPPSKRAGRNMAKFLCAVESPHNHSEWWNNVRKMVADNKTDEARALVRTFNDELQIPIAGAGVCPTGNYIIPDC